MRGFVRPLVRQSVRWSMVIEMKSGKTSVIDTVCVGVGVGVSMEFRGICGPAHLSATIL